MRNAGLDETQAGIKIAGRNINNLRYADDTTLMAEWGRTKEPLDESERRGGIGMGNTCISMADSCQCMTKTTKKKKKNERKWKRKLKKLD